jgi:hypothetical protein
MLHAICTCKLHAILSTVLSLSVTSLPVISHVVHFHSRPLSSHNLWIQATLYTRRMPISTTAALPRDFHRHLCCKAGNVLDKQYLPTVETARQSRLLGSIRLGQVRWSFVNVRKAFGHFRQRSGRHMNTSQRRMIGFIKACFHQTRFVARFP